ncbi:hypothetical protein COCMIDRAFT_22380 [Bipolaris oryzae ATCC 44560]|uniref:Uncharacterized protein n=1 Tax=Bipolaris oryzae ATCC 44560 TaxID=930090 RepID=W6ZRC0_COCMI|nr:uncharacterized protein COCMIDRAFT_22380 [Bipolaris oryzae ATCC 44560]EUC50049.1 hypothetical protein COCMIDRAFT_22380 [Bipolaris oryzae ATCC 44560]
MRSDLLLERSNTSQCRADMQEPLKRSLDSSSRPAQRDVTLIALSVEFQKCSTKAISSPSGPTIAHCIPKFKCFVSVLQVDYKKSTSSQYHQSAPMTKAPWYLADFHTTTRSDLPHNILQP